ncbi:hypothetical protein ACLMJK_005415 [Lecanora helva]
MAAQQQHHQPQQQPNSPPSSHPSSPTSTTPPTQKPTSIDLSDLPPPLIQPSPPSNTLLITNLRSQHTFLPDRLAQIRTLLSPPTHPLNSFSPLRSLHRIIISYATPTAAITMRQTLYSGFAHEVFGDDEDCIKLYFGGRTPVVGVDDDAADGGGRLRPPRLGKLLFVSPPPSPPAGWETREEEPPNREVHAGDLVEALEGVKGRDGYEEGKFQYEGGTGNGEADDELGEKEQGLRFTRKRTGTGSLMVYHPRDHGGKEDLPKVLVEDTEGGDAVSDEESDLGRKETLDAVGKAKMITHTARPPVELME